MKGLEISNLSSHYAFNDRARSASRTPYYSCNKLKKTSPALESGVYSVQTNSTHGVKAFCQMELVPPSCIFDFGDGIGGDDVRQVGTYSKPEDCISRCSQKRFDGATVDVATGTKCWCEQKMNGRDTNDLYKSCKFDGEFQAYGWLEVARLNTSKHGNFKLEDAESDDIGKLEQVTSGKFALSQAGLRTLYEGTNFTQLRFVCSKNHGRTIDIATQSPMVISWLLGYTSYWSQPSSCGTFVRPPGDNLRISRRCNDWHESKWGFREFANNFNKTMWVIPFFVWDQLHWEFPSVWFPQRGLPYYCDDRYTSDTKGVWRIFVK